MRGYYDSANISWTIMSGMKAYENEGGRRRDECEGVTRLGLGWHWLTSRLENKLHFESTGLTDWCEWREWKRDLNATFATQTKPDRFKLPQVTSPQNFCNFRVSWTQLPGCELSNIIRMYFCWDHKQIIFHNDTTTLFIASTLHSSPSHIIFITFVPFMQAYSAE